MRRICLVVLLLQVIPVTQAKEYGHYDTGKIVAISQAANGQYSANVDFALLDRILTDLSAHNTTYPSLFDSQDDRQRATHDVVTISRTLDTLLSEGQQNPKLLLRAAVLDSFGHNLDVPDAGKKAYAAFTGLLSATPSDPQANLLYGRFLLSVGRPGEAIPVLEKAKRLRAPDADYTLGLAYSAVGLRDKALQNLERYAKRTPNDPNAAKLVDAIRKGNLEIKQGSPPLN